MKSRSSKRVVALFLIGVMSRKSIIRFYKRTFSHNTPKRKTIFVYDK